GKTKTKFHTTAPCNVSDHSEACCCIRSPAPGQAVGQSCRHWESGLHCRHPLGSPAHYPSLVGRGKRAFFVADRDNAVVGTDQAIRELEAIVGPGNVLSSRAERLVYGYDASVFRGMELLAVVLPETAQQIARLVTWCQRHRVPYVARGTGTGISGAAIPTHGG